MKFMLTEKQIKEIREHLAKSQNPVFFFDNDCDGLASFLLLRRYTGKGRGVAIRSFPDLNESYTRKIQELNGDYVFVLDKAIISPGFLKEIEKLNIPLVWIDHHDTGEDLENFKGYYNPRYNKDKKGEPVSYLCYQVTEKKDDLWIALIGCISDNYIPDFSEDVAEKYPDYWRKIKTAFEGLYGTELGRIIKVLSFGLKDRTSNVVKMLKFLIDVKNPAEILEENTKTYTLLKRYEQINKKYTKLLDKARKIARNSGTLVYFQYGGDLSLSADLANELYYYFPSKTIVVAYISGTKVNVSLRGKNIKNITLKAIKGFENATGGGHEDATGAKVNVEDLPKFKNLIEEFLNHKNQE